MRGRGRGRGGLQTEPAHDDDDGWEAVTPTTQPQDDSPPAPPAHAPPFTVRSTGPRDIPEVTKEPVDFFTLLMSNDLLTKIVRETNSYANEFLAKKEFPRHSRFKRWEPTTVAELKQFIGLTMNMGLSRRKNLQTYWRKAFPSQDLPYFR